MEQTENITQLLDLIVSPAFCVKDGVIFCANQAAAHMVSPGSPVQPLLVTGSIEYAAFSGGCLYLTLKLADVPCGASVTRMAGFDVFVLENTDQAELQAMALAAQELRHPLANIMTVADNLFPLATQDDDPIVRENLARINKGLYQMLRIVGNMSDAYRYSQDVRPNLEIRDVCSVLDELFAQNAELLRHAGLTLRFTNLRESIFTLIDTEKLERAISNILSNAAKFTPKGGVIEARLTRQGTMLRLTVADSGTGVAEGLRGSVHSRYLRQPAIEDGRYGIGLGMVLIRSAASIHGGTVLMEQSPELGTRLTMTMAIRRNPESMVRTPALRVDYAGEWDHKLIELSDTLPAELYGKETNS